MELAGTFDVRAPPDRVFAFLIDPARLLAGFEGAGPVAVDRHGSFSGSIAVALFLVRGTIRYQGKYTRADPGRSVRAELHGSGFGGPFTARIEAELRPTATGTRTEWRATADLTSGAGRFAEASLRSEVERRLAAVFERARQRLETPPPARARSRPPPRTPSRPRRPS